jgi:hypothetical protein
MRLDHKKKKPVKTILLTIAVLLLLVGTYIAIAHAVTIWPFKATPVAPSITKVLVTNPSPPTGAKANDAVVPKPSGSTKPSGTSEPTTTPTSSNVSITAASQRADILSIRTLIAGIESSGTCSLTLSKGASNITTIPVVGIQAGPSSSTCQGFDISVSQYGITPGLWSITINVSSGSMTSSTKGTVTIT